MGTLLALPLSTSHSSVGAIAGAGAFYHGFLAVDWHFGKHVALAWATSPALGFCLALCLRVAVTAASRGRRMYAAVMPLLAGLTASSALAIPALVGPPAFRAAAASSAWLLPSVLGAAFVGSALYTSRFVNQKLAEGYGDPSYVPAVEGGVGSGGDGADCAALENGTERETSTVPFAAAQMSDLEAAAACRKENKMYGATSDCCLPSRSGFIMNENDLVFRTLLLCAVPALAFAHGSNDVSNGVGPFVGLVRYYKASTGGSVSEVSTTSGLMVGVMIFGGLAIGAGIMKMGHHVIETIGRGGIYAEPWTYAQGFAAQTAAAASILTASALGVPVSTSHTVVGSVLACTVPLGVRSEDGEDRERMNGKMVLNIAIGALLTPVLAGGVSAALVFAVYTSWGFK